MQMDKRPIVFVSGPFSAATRQGQDENIRKAAEAGRLLLERGCHPIVPHLLVREYYRPEDEGGPFGYEALMEYALGLLARCDAILFLGSSSGADRELALAKKLGKPVYYDIRELPGLP